MSKLHVLLVDDEQEYVEGLSERMANDGIDSEVAFSGEEGLEALEKHPPDVMVLDLRMPGMGGMEVLERARRDHPQTQVIILTGHGGKAAEQEARERGAFEYLEKPVDYAGLKNVIYQAWGLTKRVSKAVTDDIRLTFLGDLPDKGKKPTSRSDPASKKLPREGLKVLLVDDEEDFVRTLSERLELRDLASEVAFSGETALSILGDEPPDVVVLDLNMPGMGGLAVLEQIKREVPQVPVIILTGQGSPEEEAEARHLGASDYLNKPVEIGDLVKAVHSAAQRTGFQGVATAAGDL
jgi:DNA-binding NtrC family response regulator